MQYSAVIKNNFVQVYLTLKNAHEIHESEKIGYKIVYSMIPFF